MDIEPTFNPSTALRSWLSRTHSVNRKVLSEMAGFSDDNYRQWISNRRRISAAMAGRIEQVLLLLYPKRKDVENRLRRGDLCEACFKCPYYKAKNK